MDIYNPSISEQLSYNANMAEQWVLTQEREGQDCCISDPTAFFQAIRDFSNALERMAKLEKETDLEWSISLFALVELARQLALRLQPRVSKRANSPRQYRNPSTGRPETSAGRPTIRQRMDKHQETLGTQLKRVSPEVEETGPTPASRGPAQIDVDNAEWLRSCPKQGIQRSAKT